MDTDISPTQRARRRAQAILHELGILHADELDIELIAAHHDVFTRFRPLHGHEGHLLRGEGVGLVVIDAGALRSWKWRFVLAHELGHFLLHAPRRDQLHLCTDAEGRGRILHRDHEAEKQANAFASELLMPAALFEPAVTEVTAGELPDLQHVFALARRFRTSLTATALRYLRQTEHACAFVHSRRGRIDWAVSSAPFAPRLRDRGMLRHASHASAIARGQDIPNTMLPVPLEAWSRSWHASHLDLFEHSISMTRWGKSVFTMLWHELDASPRPRDEQP